MQERKGKKAQRYQVQYRNGDNGCIVDTSKGAVVYRHQSAGVLKAVEHDLRTGWARVRASDGEIVWAGR